MKNLPYVEPTIRTIAGGLVLVLTILVYTWFELTWLWLSILFLLGVNLFQSGITRFCLMEKVLKQLGFRSEISEIRELGEKAQLTSDIHANYLDTLNLLNEAVIELTPAGFITNVSDGWNKLIHTTNAEVSDSIGHKLINYIYSDDCSKLDNLFNDLSRGNNKILHVRFRIVRRGDKEHWVEGKFTLTHNLFGAVRIKGVLRDVTESYLQEKQIEHMALYDGLTNIPNRVCLESKMQDALGSVNDGNSKLGLLFFDLDNFKQVNDSYGHKVGDQLLIAISTLLKKNLRSSDTLARWGGDEFVVLVTGLHSAADMRKIAEGMMQKIQEELTVESIDFHITVSIGGAIYPDDAETIDSLLIEADKALYHAKSEGRNNVQIYSDMIKNSLGFHNQTMTTRFTNSVKQSRIQNNYQPIVDAQTFEPVGIEVLARWHDDKVGWVSPNTFIPMAENLGLICELGKQVIMRALEDFHYQLQVDSHLKLSINISNRQISSKDFTSRLLSALQHYQIKSERIKLEITESISLLGITQAREKILELSDAGFYISLDDFGTGYSSLSHLHELPVNELKIDKSFIRRIQTRDGRIMLETIAKMGREMNISVVAEGIEDKESAFIMRDMGVQALQGFYFAKPQSLDLCQEYLNSSRADTPCYSSR